MQNKAFDGIQEFYNKYTYPFADVKDSGSIGGEAMFLFLDYETDANGFKGKRFLDAGCGTGQRILDIARAFPAATFLGMDFSEKSIELAKSQLQRENITNMAFEYGDITTYSAGQKFDIITSHGVIHHLKEPGEGVGNLSRLLADDGLLVIWLYHTYGEFGRMLERDTLKTLLQGGSLDIAVETMREMGYNISQNRYGKSYGKQLTPADELSKDADAFLHPWVLTYTFQDAASLLAGAGLDWMAVEQINIEDQGLLVSLEENEMTPAWMLDIKSFLKSGKAYELYKRLDKWDKLHVMELVTRPTGFTVYAGKRGGLKNISKRAREGVIALGENLHNTVKEHD